MVILSLGFDVSDFGCSSRKLSTVAVDEFVFSNQRRSIFRYRLCKCQVTCVEISNSSTGEHMCSITKESYPIHVVRSISRITEMKVAMLQGGIGLSKLRYHLKTFFRLLRIVRACLRPEVHKGKF